MNNLKYRTDWFEGADRIGFFYGTRTQCMSKARRMSKRIDSGAYVVASNGKKDIGCIFFSDGTISYRDGKKI